MAAASSKAGLPNDEDVPEHLTCPVCFNLPEKEVFQCRDGHVLCSKCYFKLKECPQCRGPLDKAHPIRNRHFEDELEKFAQSCLQSECEQPCRQNGRRLYYKRLGSSINLCKFLKQNCNCNFEFNLSSNPEETVNHIVSVHGAKLTKSKEFLMELCNFPGDGSSSGIGRSTPASGADGSILQLYSSIVTNLEEKSCYVFSIPVRNISSDLFQIASYFLPYSSVLRGTAIKPGFKMEYSIGKPAGGLDSGSAWRLVVVQDPKPLMEAEEIIFDRLSRSLEVSLLRSFLTAEKNLLINCKILLEPDGLKTNGKEAALESFKCQTTSTSSKKTEGTPKRWRPLSGIPAAHELLRDLHDLLSSPGPVPQVAALDMLDLILASALNKEGGYLLEFGKEDFEYILYGAVFKVVELGSLEALKKMLALKDFNWGVVSMIGATLLHRAMGDKDLNRGVEKAKLHLDKINPKALDDNHRSLAHYAALSSNGKAVELACRLGVDVNGKDKMGTTPLHLAMKNAKGPEVTVDKVEILLKYGADPDAKDNEGKTPLDVVRETGNEYLMERVTRLIEVRGDVKLN